jgi:hypothetical protein
MSNQFTTIEKAAHTAAESDHSPQNKPSQAQRNAGNYKLGKVHYQGFAIGIENPRGTYRTGIDANGNKWKSRLSDHYGKLLGTRGADGDAIDVFLGQYPNATRVYAINQFINGRFDELKLMMGYQNMESARLSYMLSYERGWKGLGSIIEMTYEQLRWWLKNGNHNMPINKDTLPFTGLESMNTKPKWVEDQLTNTSIDRMLYDLRRGGDGLMLDSVTLQDIYEDSDGVVAFDALVIPYQVLERRMKVMERVLNGAGGKLKVGTFSISEPFKQRGTVNIAVVFEMTDGQTVTILFHNPDIDPTRIVQTDELVSWRWMINKKDVTVAVAPELGKDLDIRTVAKRIMTLAEKNSDAFARANTKKGERLTRIEGLKTEIAGLETELTAAQKRLEVARIEAEMPKVVELQPEKKANINGESMDINQFMNFVKSSYSEFRSMPVMRTGKGHKGLQKHLNRVQKNADVSTYLRKLGFVVLGFAPDTPSDEKITEVFNSLLASTKIKTQITPEQPTPDPIQEVYASEDVLGNALEESSAETQPVVINGDELGEFPDTREGKKELRAAAEDKFKEILGQWVPCPALGGDVEIRKAGVKKVISLSADKRKLQIIPLVKEIIGSAKKLNTRPAYDNDTDISAKFYHTMRTEIVLNEESLAVRTVIKEDIQGVFHYDMTVHGVDSVFDSGAEKSPTEAGLLNMTITNGGGTYPAHIARHQLDNILAETDENVNEAELDSGVETETNLLDDVKENGLDNTSPSTAITYESEVRLSTDRLADGGLTPQSGDATTSNDRGTNPSDLASCQLDNSVTEDNETNNPTLDNTTEKPENKDDQAGEEKTDDADSVSGQDLFLDSARGRLVLNLFIEGEEPEYIDEIEDDEITDEQSSETEATAAEEEAGAEGGELEPVETEETPINEGVAEEPAETDIAEEETGDVVEDVGETEITEEPTETEEVAEETPDTTEIDTEIESLRSETDIPTFDKRLDDLAAKIEEAGLMEQYEPVLNEVADILTGLLAEAEKEV